MVESGESDVISVACMMHHLASLSGGSKSDEET